MSPHVPADLRQALRALRRAPGFTAAAVLTLALGIGAATAIFSVVNGVLLRPLPFPDPDRLVLLHERARPIGLDRMWVSLPNFRDWRERARSFEEMAAFNAGEAGLTGAGEPEQVRVAWSEGPLLELLGARAVAGRGLAAADDEPGAPAAVVLGHGLWQRRFGGDPAAVGSTVRLDGEPFTVVGVMAPGFAFPDLADAGVEAWVTTAPLVRADPDLLRRGNHWLAVVARLRPGATPESARREMLGLARALREENPDSFDDGVDLTPLAEEVVGGARRPLLLLLGAVGLLLAIACANVAGLLLARGAWRGREIGIRAALGAGRARLVRQLLVESVVLALAAGAAGLLLANWGVEALLSLSPASLPRLDEVGVDGRVLAFGIAVSTLTGAAFGLLPALHASRQDPAALLGEGALRTTAGPRRARLARVLVVVELALAVVLLAGAGLLARSLSGVRGVDPGFDPRGVVLASVSLPTSVYAERERWVAFFDDVLERLRAHPGVTAAGVVTDPPLSGSGRQTGLRIEGAPQPPPGQQPPLTDIQVVSPGYPDAAGIQLVRGRTFEPADGPDAPLAALVDEVLVRRYWPDTDPVGRRLALDDDESGRPRWREVVGVVESVKHYGVDLDAERRAGGELVRPTVYLPHRQEPESSMTIAVRTDGDPAAVVPVLREAVRAVDPAQPVGEVRLLRDLMADSLGPRRLHTVLLGGFAVAALLLAAIGTYGLVAQAVARRAREIGIRIAVGARDEDVVGMIVRQGAALATAGAAAGLAAALGATRLLEGLLFGVGARDPVTLAAVVSVLVAATLLASWIPARRASRIDPIEVLRSE
ncbi:MAG TPA: ABC transporter permease [Gemmatimonadota bacterium]